MKINLTISILILIVYLVTNLIIPTAFKGGTIFVADTVLWTTVIIATILISKLTQTRILQANKTLVEIAAILAVFQIFLAVFLSFFMGFGKNMNVWNPTTLAIYFPYLLMPLIATELSRAQLAKAVPKQKSTLTLLLISLFYTFMVATIPNYLELTTPLAIAEFLIRTFIPSLAISLLATYFAFLGGFPTSLTYMAIPAFFTWFSPILPNIQWQTQSMLTATAATIGFILLDNATKPPLIKQIHRTLKKQKSQLPYWTAIVLIGSVAVWSSTGLLGFTPTIIASGSMQPTMDVGDIAIVVKAPTQTIKIGDIIQYRTPDMLVMHRVIEVTGQEGSEVFVTQGDANNVPDDPVLQSQVMGKVLFTIPKLGWVSIALKTFFAEIITFFTTNLTYAFTTLGIIVSASIFSVHRYRNQPLRKLRRRLGR